MAVVLPLNTTETWAEHFSTRGWSSPQDQINAGHPLFCAPNPESGEYSEVFDFGSVIAAARAEVVAVASTMSGSPTVTISTDFSGDGTTWTTGDGESSVFATNARYVRARIAVSGGVARISDISAKMSAKIKSDAGSISAVSTDANGTWVPFVTTFVSVTSITPTPSGTTAAYATANYDPADTSGFRVLLFNQSGTRISGPIFWAAKGY